MLKQILFEMSDRKLSLFCLEVGISLEKFALIIHEAHC